MLWSTVFDAAAGLGSVMVRLWEEDSSVCVRVEDDGVGFDPAEVDLEKAQEAGRQRSCCFA